MRPQSQARLLTRLAAQSGLGIDTVKRAYVYPDRVRRNTRLAVQAAARALGLEAPRSPHGVALSRAAKRLTDEFIASRVLGQNRSKSKPT